MYQGLNKNNKNSIGYWLFSYRVRSEILPKAPSAANNVPTRFSTTMVNNKVNNTSDSNFFQRLRTSSAINKTVVAKQTKEGAGDTSRLTLSILYFFF